MRPLFVGILSLLALPALAGTHAPVSEEAASRLRAAQARHDRFLQWERAEAEAQATAKAEAEAEAVPVRGKHGRGHALIAGLMYPAARAVLGLAPIVGMPVFAYPGYGGGASSSAGLTKGPTSSTDNAIVRWDGTTGGTLQDSAVTIADTTGATTITGSGGYYLGNTSVGIVESGTDDLDVVADGAVQATFSGGVAGLFLGQLSSDTAITAPYYTDYATATVRMDMVAGTGFIFDTPASRTYDFEIGDVDKAVLNTNGFLLNGGGYVAVGGATDTVNARIQEGATDDLDLVADNSIIARVANTGIVHRLGTSASLDQLVGGVLSAQTTAVGNVGAGEDDLITYSLAANSLVANGRGIRATAYGSFANNGNAKTLTCYSGTQAVNTHAPTVSVAGELWNVTWTFIRTGSSAQDWKSEYRGNTGTAGAFDYDPEMGTATQTETAAITIKCTGTGVADNDIVMDGLLVEAL